MTISIVKGAVPGATERITELHGAYYLEHSGFGQYFENKVATELRDFMARYDDRRDGIWLALQAGQVQASIVIDGLHADTDAAHLRWFIASDSMRGHGIGQTLLTAALDFCRSRRYRHVRLWTFAGLNAARHLYEKNGFQLARQQQGSQWGAEVTEQCFECSLPVHSSERNEDA